MDNVAGDVFLSRIGTEAWMIFIAAAAMISFNSQQRSFILRGTADFSSRHHASVALSDVGIIGFKFYKRHPLHGRSSHQDHAFNISQSP